jgi:cation:H+ antiporter
VTLAGISFIVGAAVSLTMSWLLVTRLERVGERLGISEALLGVIAALAADAPEITSSISALTQHQFGIGVGVVIGSNVFNLAALLGLGALVAGEIHLPRRVVVLGGAVALWIAVAALATSSGVTTPLEGLVPAGLAMVAYVLVVGPSTLRRALPLPKRLATWLALAVSEEQVELAATIRARRGTWRDGVVAAGSLIVVVVASVAMERGAAKLGHHFHVADAIIGGVVLAAVTSLPNAVAGVYLAARGRASAAFSTALNSNNLNIVVGLLIPGVILGLAAPSAVGNVTAGSYLFLTAMVIAVAYVARGLRRGVGWLIVGLYVTFVVVVIAVA